MADTILDLITRVQIAPLQAGMAEAASAVKTSVASMKADFASAASASDQMAAQLRAQGTSTAEAQQVMQALGFSSKETAASLAAIGPASAGLAEVAPAADQAKYSITEARIAAQGLAGDLGVRMPRALTTMLARMPEIGPLLASAFSAVAVIALIEVVDQLDKKLTESMDALVGWGAAAKKAYSEALQANLEQVNRNIETQTKLNEQNEIGLTGAAKQDAHLKNLSEEQKEWASAAADTARQIREVQARLLDLQSFKEKAIVAAVSLGDMSKLNADVSELEARLQRLNKQQEEQQQQLGRTRVEIPGEGKTAGADRAKEGIEAEAARSEAIKAIGLADVAFQQQLARQRYAADLTTIDQEVEALRTAENQKFAIEQAYNERSRQLLERKHAETGENVTPQLTKLGGDETAQAENHQAALSAIDATGAAERKRINDAAEQAEIESKEKSSLAGISISEKWIEQERSLQRISIAEETALLTTAETQRYQAQMNGLQQRLKIAQDEPEKNKALIISLNGEIEALEIEHQGRLDAIKSEGSQKQLEEDKRLADEKLSAAEQAASRELAMARETDNARLKAHQVTLGQWEADELGAINRWYQAQSAALEKALANAKAVYGEQSLEYQKLQDRLAALDQQRGLETKKVVDDVKLKYEQAYAQVTQTLNRSVTSWILGQQTFAQAMKQIWTSLASMAIEEILRIAEKHSIELAFMAAANALFHTQTAAQDAAGNAAKMASTAATDVFVVTSMAGAAGAAAFASVMEALPFPANVATAPGVMAAAIATALGNLSLASAAGGMMVPSDMLAMVHQDERILPAKYSRGLDNMVAAAADGRSGGNAGGGGDVHLHYAPNVHAFDKRGVKKLLEQHSGVLSGIVRSEVRRGRLNLP